MTGAEQIVRSLSVLRGEIERLEALGLGFAASLVRMAEIELKVRLHKLSDEEIDVLTFAANPAEQDRAGFARRRLKRGTV